MIQKKKMSFKTTLFIIAVAIAVYSQFPNVDKDLWSLVNRVVWVILLGYFAITEKKIQLSIFLIRTLIVLGLFTIIEYLLLGFGVINNVSNFIALFPIPIAVYYVSYVTATDKDECKCVINVYCVMVIIMAIAIAIMALGNISEWLVTETYLYDGSTHKNSTAQLLGCGFLIVFNYIKGKGFWSKLAKLLVLVIFIISLLYVQSRSSLVVLAVVIFVMGFLQQGGKHRLLYFFALAVIVIFILSSDQILSIINQAFFVDKYSDGSGLDWNLFSSGRLELYKNAWAAFIENPIFGVGSAYVDNFYLLALATGGILLGLPLIGIYFYRIYLNISRYRNCRTEYKNIARLGVVISLYYIGISIFEGYPPYGPGVASMFLWMISGFVDGMSVNSKLRGNSL